MRFGILPFNPSPITHYALRITRIIIICFIYLYILCGCGQNLSPDLEIPSDSKGYVLYVFAKKTEVMIDFCKSDGIRYGTKLDILRPDVPGMDEPVKIAEVAVVKVGSNMSKAKVTAFTSSLQMERGDRVFPHPLLIVSDASWLASRKPIDGWKTEPSLTDTREWAACEVLPDSQLNIVPEMRQLSVETDAKPIWHPSVSSHHGEVFFRKAFIIDAKVSTAKLNILCGGRVNIYLNDRWVGETKEWPQISSFKVSSLLNQGRNLLAIQVDREPRIKEPPLLFLALSIQTEFVR